MQQKHDILETPLFLMKNISDTKCIIFNNTKLYNLFKKFMDESTITNQLNPDNSPKSLTTYIAIFDDSSKRVTLKTVHGRENIIGKFFLETNLDWPQEYYDKDQYLLPEYKQPVIRFTDEEVRRRYGKGVTDIYLARQGKAIIPESIIELMNNFNPNDEIKQIASLIVQAYRSSPGSKFQFFKQDFFIAGVSHQLEPNLSEVDAATKMQKEIKQSYEFQEELMRPFSFKDDEITFNINQGTHVNIEVSPVFIKWLFQFELTKPVQFTNNYVLFKKSENVISFNKGPGTPGIEITNKGSSCYVCNNRTADEVYNSSTSEVFSARKAQLKGILAQLYSLGSIKAVPVTAPEKADLPVMRFVS